MSKRNFLSIAFKILGVVSLAYTIVLIPMIILSCGEYGLTESYIKKSINDYMEEYIGNSLPELDSFEIMEIYILENKPMELENGVKVPNRRIVLVENKIQLYWTNYDLTNYAVMLDKEVELGILTEGQGQNYKQRLRKPNELVFKKDFMFVKEIGPGNISEDWEMIGRYSKWEFLVENY